MHNTSATHQPNSQQQMAKSLNYNVLTIDWCLKCNTIKDWQTCVWSHCICDIQTLLEAPFILIEGQGPCCLKPIICTPLTIVGSYLFNTTPFTIVHKYFDSLPLLLCVGLSQLRWCEEGINLWIIIEQRWQLLGHHMCYGGCQFQGYHFWSCCCWW